MKNVSSYFLDKIPGHIPSLSSCMKPS